MIRLQKAFDQAIADCDDAIADREIATEERTEKANLLYADLVKLCTFGKEIWAHSNEAKYNDYVIYNTPTGSPEAAEPVAGDAVIL